MCIRDRDYRGKVQVVVQNVGREIVVIEPGQIFAQMSVSPIYIFDWILSESLTPTERGSGGFGSTDTKGGDHE